MKLLRFLTCLLLATACHSTRPAAEGPPAPLAPVATRVDTTHTTPRQIPQKLVQDSPKKTLLQKINPFYKSETQKKAGPQTAQNATQMPRKCKGCQFTLIRGNDNKVSQATIGKKAGPAVIASDSVGLTNQAGSTNATAIKGNGNTVTPTNTAPKAPGIGSTIADNLSGPLGVVLGLAAGGAGLYFLIAFLIRRKAAKTIA